jgi:hypothetical protein
MSDKEPRSNVIPLIREKKTREIIKNEFDAAKKRTLVDKMNDKLDEIRDENMLQLGFTESTLPPTDELEKEYRRKQDEAKKKREQNNRDVTRSYRLSNKPDKPRR